MAITLERFSASHATPAAQLVRDQIAALRRETPELAETCGSPETLTARLEQLAHRGRGAAALDGGRLVGFLAAIPIRSFAGRPSMMSPEWGNAIAPGLAPAAAKKVREVLYAEAAREWDLEGTETHLLCLLAHDRAAIETYSWLGFGGVVCDAVRSLTPITKPQVPWEIRRAKPGDADLVNDFDHRLHAHMAASPIFLAHDAPEDVDGWVARITDASFAIWIAEGSGHSVGYLIQGPATDDACDLIVDSGTSSITGAYVLPEARGGGAAAALLSRAVDWAGEQGYARLSVDFETANLEGSRFWLRYFRPVVVSWARTIRACDVHESM